VPLTHFNFRLSNSTLLLSIKRYFTSETAKYEVIVQLCTGEEAQHTTRGYGFEQQRE
jgi:hypothetical protein